MAFEEYPKRMQHPSHTAAIIKPAEGQGLFKTEPVCLAYEKFPDVTVANKSQEQQYAARGYRPVNVGNSEEYDQAILEAAPVGGYKFQEYPKWKYHPLELPCIVKSAQEEAALGDGWSDHPVIATEDDLADEEGATDTKPEPVAAASTEPAPARAKAKPKAKAPAKAVKRSKAPRAAHAHA